MPGEVASEVRSLPLFPLYDPFYHLARFTMFWSKKPHWGRGLAITRLLQYYPYVPSSYLYILNVSQFQLRCKFLVLHWRQIADDFNQMRLTGKELVTGDWLICWWQVKNKMLDSQNETIKELKLELSQAKEAFRQALKSSDALQTDWTSRLQIEINQVFPYSNTLFII